MTQVPVSAAKTFPTRISSTRLIWWCNMPKQLVSTSPVLRNGTSPQVSPSGRNDLYLSHSLTASSHESSVIVNSR